MNLSIIIINYNVFSHLIKCIESIKENLKGCVHEIIVVDNNSTERLIDNLTRMFPEVKLIKLDRNIGFGAANNFAVKHAVGKYLLLINPDVIVQQNSIQKLMQYIEEGIHVGIAAPALFRPNGEFDYYNSFLPSVYSILMIQFSFYNRARGMRKKMFYFFDEKIEKGSAFQVEQAMGACVLIRKAVFDALGGFDEAFFLYQEETDLEYRMLKKGWKTMILPDAKAIHHHHASTSELGEMFVSFHWLRSIIIYYIKNFGITKRLGLRFTMFIGLLLRQLKYLFIYIFDFKKLIEVSRYTFRLIGLNFLPRKHLLKNRFVFDRQIN